MIESDNNDIVLNQKVSKWVRWLNNLPSFDTVTIARELVKQNFLAPQVIKHGDFGRAVVYPDGREEGFDSLGFFAGEPGDLSFYYFSLDGQVNGVQPIENVTEFKPEHLWSGVRNKLNYKIQQASFNTRKNEPFGYQKVRKVLDDLERELRE